MRQMTSWRDAVVNANVSNERGESADKEVGKSFLYQHHMPHIRTHPCSLQGLPVRKKVFSSDLGVARKTYHNLAIKPALKEHPISGNVATKRSEDLKSSKKGGGEEHKIKVQMQDGHGRAVLYISNDGTSSMASKDHQSYPPVKHRCSL